MIDGVYPLICLEIIVSILLFCFLSWIFLYWFVCVRLSRVPLWFSTVEIVKGRIFYLFFFFSFLSWIFLYIYIALLFALNYLEFLCFFFCCGHSYVNDLYFVLNLDWKPLPTSTSSYIGYVCLMQYLVNSSYVIRP